MNTTTWWPEGSKFHDRRHAHTRKHAGPVTIVLRGIKATPGSGPSIASGSHCVLGNIAAILPHSRPQTGRKAITSVANPVAPTGRSSASRQRRGGGKDSFKAGRESTFK